MALLIILFSRINSLFVYDNRLCPRKYMRNERGMDTTWMPYMWPIKSCLWIGIVFLLIQGISELFKSYYAAVKGKWPGS